MGKYRSQMRQILTVDAELSVKLTVKFDNRTNVWIFLAIPILPMSFVIIYKLVKHFLSGDEMEYRLQFIEIKIVPYTRVMLKKVFKVPSE